MNLSATLSSMEDRDKETTRPISFFVLRFEHMAILKGIAELSLSTTVV